MCMREDERETEWNKETKRTRKAERNRETQRGIKKQSIRETERMRDSAEC